MRLSPGGIPIDEGDDGAEITAEEWAAARTALARHVALVTADPITRAVFEATTAEIDEHQRRLHG